MKINHIYHSAFMITMENSTMLFDWYKGDLPRTDPDKKLFVFCSHSHGDHYSDKIWDLQKTHSDVTYILDEGIEEAKQHAEADILFVSPRQKYTLTLESSDSDRSAHSASIVTLTSTDMGVAFCIETEGRRIYHAGDLNVWFWNDEPMEDNIASEKKCREEMAFLAGILKKYPSLMELEDGPVTGAFHKSITLSSGRQVAEETGLLDAAFVPLDFRLEEHAPRCIAAFMEILGARYVFPMHYWGKRSQVMEYMKDDRISSYTDRIHFDDEFEI